MKITKKITHEIIFEDDSNMMKYCVINAILSGANLGDADLHDADLHGADLHGTNLGGTDLRGANLCGTDLRYANLGYADLRGTNLRGANLGYADLGYADIRGANLGYANLCYTNLCGANLGYANLCYTNLGGADLGYADLRGTNLCSADLHGANIRGTNLCYANLYGVNLCSAKDIPFFPLSCPSDGEFIGWKKVYNKLVRLLIPSDAKRSSSTSNKCRCDKAKVLEITDLDGSNPIVSVTNWNYIKTQYVVGEMVFPDSFDENRWNECSHGIHFFINKQDAINY